MRRTIENMWNGNLMPGKNCGTKEQEIEDIIKLIDRNKEDISKELNERQKETLEKYSDCMEEYLYLLTQQAFCDGFCLASKLMAEALI